jgi:hypothetical protein
MKKQQQNYCNYFSVFSLFFHKNSSKKVIPPTQQHFLFANWTDYGSLIGYRNKYFKPMSILVQ